MPARLRRPNLVQFIGATLDAEMIILTALMHTSLRKVLEQEFISCEHIISISIEVCKALNYLHLMQPDPVIHRDISSANVLLDPIPNNRWRVKVTDYGSVNTLRCLQTENPGNPVYAAPELDQSDGRLLCCFTITIGASDNDWREDRRLLSALERQGRCIF